MQNQFDYVRRLTSSNLPVTTRNRLLNDFAYDFGWRPSDILDIPYLKDIATAHLVVEHGLENTAVISFIEQSTRYTDLRPLDQRRLLRVSYNNLIDWHIPVSYDQIATVYNRTKQPTIVDTQQFTRETIDKLRSQTFEEIVEKRPNANVPALDDALIDTISYWKRELAAQTDGAATNINLSSFFNAIIFVRAIEDRNRQTEGFNSSLLTDIWDSTTLTPRAAIFQALLHFDIAHIPDFLITPHELAVFDSVNRSTIGTLFSEFYRNKFAPYEYDFSLMSKHALSRIYEHYASVLRVEETNPQLSLPILPRLPEEERNKSLGSIYTPQYVARFFAKFLRNDVGLTRFRSLRIIDPAVGSGIFLRTLLELQFTTEETTTSSEEIANSIESVYGIDLDQNAVQATRLSLSLLHLVLTDRLPATLNVYVSEAIDFFEHNPQLQDSFDTVVANPPFISWGRQPQEIRERVARYMGDLSKGRADMYLAFLKLAVELLRPGGFGLFVLPHSFLFSKSAANIRKYLVETAYIRCLADLSAIRVFEDTSVYIILLIFQKKSLKRRHLGPRATILKCQDLVGQALQATLEQQVVDSNFYSVFTVEQETFRSATWAIALPVEAEINSQLAKYPPLEEFVEIRQGIITGADDVFIVENHEIPPDEISIYAPLLPDRDMIPYSVPDHSNVSVFFPYLNGEKLTEEQLESLFPRTWERLQRRRKPLQNRGGLSKYGRAWWEPLWLRSPSYFGRPKIVSPHLILLPRFALDIDGIFTVSHAPMIFAKQREIEVDLLKYFTAVLNSTVGFWFISLHSHRYSKGYLMLESKTLKETRVPNPSNVDPTQLRQLIELVDSRIHSDAAAALEIERAIDRAVADIYQLRRQDRETLKID